MTRHLIRGAIGFTALIAAVALVPAVGALSLLLLPVALMAFRGCPTCWVVALLESISRGRLERECGDGRCTVAARHH